MPGALPAMLEAGKYLEPVNQSMQETLSDIRPFSRYVARARLLHSGSLL